jgi:hypothetical protein
MRGEAMKDLMTITIYFFILLVISSCAQVKHYSPQQINRQYSLTNFSIQNSNIIVKDFRADVMNSDNIGILVKQQLLSSFVGQTQNFYIINIDIIEHKAFFTLGNWNGKTQFRIHITTTSGKDIAFFDAVGNSSLSNLWGYKSAEDASQNAYNAAITDLMSKLSHIKTN